MNDSYELYQQCRLERDLLREEIQKSDAEIDNLVLTNKIIGNHKECFKLEIKRQKGEIDRFKGLLEKAKPYVEHCSELTFMTNQYPIIIKWLSDVSKVNL